LPLVTVLTSVFADGGAAPAETVEQVSMHAQRGTDDQLVCRVPNDRMHERRLHAYLLFNRVVAFASLS